MTVPGTPAGPAGPGTPVWHAGSVLDVIPFSRPYRSPHEQRYLAEALSSGHLQGDGPMTAAATERLKVIAGVDYALLTPSCTQALEMAAMLLDLGPDDEVVVPSFTFSATASAVAIRGATPVFADIDPRTLNLAPDSLQACLTDRTKAVFLVHYGGVGADMDAIDKIARDAGVAVVEDNAHGLGGTWRGRKLGTFGAMSAQSFHVTKNVQCGEGGALLVNDPQYMDRAEIIREKGTDRSKFLRGQVDKYTWNDVGSSYLPSELQAAVLRSQLEAFGEIQQLRHTLWNSYANGLAGWAERNGVTLMHVPDEAGHSAHVFYVLMPSHDEQTRMLAHLKERGVVGTFHYIPLDTSPAGLKFGRAPTPCTVTRDISSRLVRLPLWAGLPDAAGDRVVDAVTSFRTGARLSV